MAQENISYTEKVGGWTSFHSFIPDWMAKLNNRFFSIKNGNLWLHNDEENPVRNNFYGVQYNSKIKTIFNESPSDDKIFKTLNLESNKPWKAVLTTNYSNGQIYKNEFEKKESRWFAYTRKNENDEDLNGNTGQGVGVITSSSGLIISFGYVSEMVSIGDQLFQINGSQNELIGEISNRTSSSITVDAVVTAPINGLFCYSKKNARIEGGEIRGYFMEVELENDDTDAVELFAINSNVVKSYV